MTTTKQRRICTGYEPIPGYRLEKFIGKGGFGEVWRSNAPGGIKKAVKFVFGAHDEQRAERELKSLERIKSVRHPFLLTLERFGIVDDQLVVVTELADGSLEDVFREHRDRGSCGIPRDKLLSHLHDAADALDYLHQEYQLQHLDIKPGNLLIVGGHVKVADFGLLKDLRDADCSIVGGLTPAYAPPEVFDGRPSLHSDQYSLAVMYQELLTGTRPFTGRTIAQLATQHVHNAPDLEPLPPSDRPAAARALEKNPDRRFANCRSFIEAMMASPNKPITIRSHDSELASDETDANFHAAMNPKSVADLPSLGDGKVGRRVQTISKVLLVSLGGVGAEVLQDLRGRIASLHSASPIELHSILIDTDSATIDAGRIANSIDALPRSELVHIPLRPPQQYRESISNHRLQTLSRRWIYNIPRSLQTEGMRPLGRLALVDHGSKVIEAISRAVTRLKADGNNNENLKVFVVGSLSGGTGGGIYIDVVHLLRDVLDKNGMEQATILSMLALKGLVHHPSLSLAHHDAHSALLEINHFMQPGNGYPGDIGAGWPSVPAARTPLKDAYLIASNELDSNAPCPVQIIGDYLWTDTTGAGALLEQARQTDLDPSKSTIDQPQLRSVGIVPLGVLRRPEEEILTPATARHLLLTWLGHPAEAKLKANDLFRRLLRRCRFDSDDLMKLLSSEFESEQSPGTMEIVSRCSQLHTSENEESDLLQLGEMVTGWAFEILDRPHIAEWINDITLRLTRELSTRFTHERLDVTTALETLQCLRQFVESEVSRLRTHAESMNESVLEADLKLPPESTSYYEIANRLIESMVYRLASELASQFAKSIIRLSEKLRDLATTFAVVISTLSEGRDATQNPWDAMPEPIASQYHDIVLELHKELVSSVIVRSLPEGRMLPDPTALMQRLTEAASPLIGRTLALGGASSAASCTLGSLESFDQATQMMDRGTNASLERINNSRTESAPLSSTTGTSLGIKKCGIQGEEPQPVTSMATAMQMVRPGLLDYGGVQRLILSVGTHSEQVRLEAELRQYHSGELTVMVIPGTTAKLIHEAQQIDLCEVIARLSTLNASNAQLSSRLMTRSDIHWRKCERPRR
ncbi:Tubulin-like protein [Novipirellula aureliae]|uniref:Tubulin-like protein n=1 Tax=Novipirellula aureliae TaxID=2527966 RepID=A0A5C6E3Q4_9BACT|nr:tubulin-like doman-containing protein [Novipirellula aureliae]TWU43114.1 Tubulin-like protein [Novipirellula aureliae]